jgi:hypothetical protein
MTVYLSPASRCFFTVRFLIVGCIAVSIPNFPLDDMDPIISVAHEDDPEHSCFHPFHLRTSVPDLFIGRKRSLPHNKIAYAQSSPGGLSSSMQADRTGRLTPAVSKGFYQITFRAWGKRYASNASDSFIRQ